VTDRKKRTGIHFGLKRSGAAFVQRGTVDRYRKVDPTWKGKWPHAFQETPDEWTAEVAVPLGTLSDSGIDVKNLQLNCMSESLTGSGLESIFLVDPAYGADFKRCIRFRPLAGRRVRAPDERRFRVRLHFAEIDGAAIGQRVFDVAIQGRTVLEDFDVAQQAGGQNVALVKELTGVTAGAQMTIELTPKAINDNALALPAICALEIVEEG